MYGYMTIAFGERYRRMAFNLLRSYRHHCGKRKFAIVTDKKDRFTKEFDDTIIQKPERQGFMSKLMIDVYAPYQQTIFIDADCLVGSNIDWWFDEFEKNNSDVSAFGWNVDVEKTLNNPDEYYFQFEKCKQYGIQYIPSFNGGVYYIRKGKVASKVFSDARSFADTGFDGGFLLYGDEPFIALAMTVNACKCLSINQILFFPRAKILSCDMETESYVYEQFGERYNRLGVFHFGNKHTKRYIYKFWASKASNGSLVNLLYSVGFHKTMLGKMDIVRDNVIKIMVSIKHIAFDKTLIGRMKAKKR